MTITSKSTANILNKYMDVLQIEIEALENIIEAVNGITGIRNYEKILDMVSNIYDIFFGIDELLMKLLEGKIAKIDIENQLNFLMYNFQNMFKILFHSQQIKTKQKELFSGIAKQLIAKEDIIFKIYYCMSQYINQNTY